MACKEIKMSLHCKTKVVNLYDTVCIVNDRYIHDWVTSMPQDCAEPIPLSSRHWYTPSSCDVTSVMISEDPAIWKRWEGLMGSALNNQVMLGEGLPLATQVKRAEEPGETGWLVMPSTMDTGSVEERRRGNMSAGVTVEAPESRIDI